MALLRAGFSFADLKEMDMPTVWFFWKGIYQRRKQMRDRLRKTKGTLPVVVIGTPDL